MSAVGSLERRASTPHATIGCQELLRTPNIGHSGFLRKQLTFKSDTSNNFLSQIKKVVNQFWEQRYVVLTEGSLYHFKSETSKKPSGSYSLAGYNQVVLAGDISPTQHPWAFKIIHETGTSHKYFQAASETELKSWQRQIRGQIIIANGGLCNNTTRISQRARMPEPSCENEDLDQPVYEIGDSDHNTRVIRKRIPRLENQPNFSVPVDREDSEDSDDDYLEIDDEIQKSSAAESRPLPQLPTERNNVSPASSGGHKERTLTRDEADEGVKILALMNFKNPEYCDEEMDNNKLSPNPPKGRPPGLSPTNKLPTPDGPPPPRHRLQSTPSYKNSEKPSLHPTAKPVPSIPGRTKPVPEVPNSPVKTVSDVPKKTDGPKFGVPMFGFGAAAVPPATKPKPGLRKLSTALEEEPEKPKFSDRKVPQPPGSRPVPTFPRSPKLEAEPERMSWQDFYWTGPDAQACQQILRNINEEGVFLVRESDQGTHKTLVCFLDACVRKFKITTTDDGRYSLEANWYFPSVEELLQHYMCNNLPNRTTQLSAPYSKRT